jgi:hypothetical protein
MVVLLQLEWILKIHNIFKNNNQIEKKVDPDLNYLKFIVKMIFRKKDSK